MRPRNLTQQIVAQAIDTAHRRTLQAVAWNHLRSDETRWGFKIPGATSPGDALYEASITRLDQPGSFYTFFAIAESSFWQGDRSAGIISTAKFSTSTRLTLRIRKAYCSLPGRQTLQIVGPFSRTLDFTDRYQIQLTLLMR